MIGSERSEIQRLVVLVGAVVFVDTMFYAAIAPLLPQLAHELRLSKLSAGVMTASYPFGTLVAAIPGGFLAARAGPRFTVCAGLALLAMSTLAFGLLNNPVALDIARLVEGIGGACSWAGGLAWIVAAAPTDRRGALIGAALGAAIGGALFGPVIGTLAAAVGRAAAFSSVVAVSVALIAIARRMPAPTMRSDQGMVHLREALRGRDTITGMWLVGLPAIASGLINVLGPLRLHRFGATALAVGAVFLVSAAIEAVVSPAIGHFSDRRGRLAPLRFGLASTAILLACFTLPRTVALLAVVLVMLSTALGTFWAPSMAMLSDAADAHLLNQGLAAALMNLAWAGGQILGSGVGGATAKAAGDNLPTLITAALCVVTLVTIGVRAAPAVRAAARSR